MLGLAMSDPFRAADQPYVLPIRRNESLLGLYIVLSTDPTSNLSESLTS